MYVSYLQYLYEGEPCLCVRYRFFSSCFSTRTKQEEMALLGDGERFESLVFLFSCVPGMYMYFSIHTCVPSVHLHLVLYDIT